MKTSWNLKLLYKSHIDPKIEEDLKKVEKAYSDFEKKYRSKDFISNEEALLKALLDYEKLAATGGGITPYLYFHYVRDLNAADQEAEAQMNKINQRLTAIHNKIVFFEIILGKIGKKKQKMFLSSKRLSHFSYYLKCVFGQASHMLSEAEEKILSLKSLTSRQLWISGFDKMLSKQTVKWKDQELPLSQASSLIFTLPPKDRYKLHGLLMEKLESISEFTEAEINAIYTDKKINDSLRDFKNPYDATLLSHQTDEKMVLALREAVVKCSKTSHRFYKLKAKLLGLKKLAYADRGVRVGKVKKEISFEAGLDLVRKSFREADPYFEKVLDNYLENGQIDVYPKKGKTGGAYCSSSLNNPTFVLLNHVSSMASVTTLAHEMGHAIHSEFSKEQSPLYVDYSTAVAEVASTFFEQIVFDNIFQTLSRKEKIIALHDRLSEAVQTIFRQIACFNFEEELHLEIRSKGAVSKEAIATMMNKHMKAYLGPVFDLKENDGYFFVQWSHIRNFFYVYSYAYGALISRALYKKYKKDPAYLDKIKIFLKAGGSKSPHDIFKDIGINTSDPAFWKEGIDSIEGDIKLLESMLD